jgi:penicillin-binding protein 2
VLARQSSLHASDRELSRFHFRVVLAAVAVLAALSLLGARFYYLQVIQHDYYSTRAEDNRISVVPIVPNRGVIVDRAGIVLARNYSAFTLEITPSNVEDLEATIDGLSKVIDIEFKDKRRFRKLLEEGKSFESLPIRTRLTEEEVARFAANRYLFPGVEVKARLFRQYPLGSVASHAIGYINRINKRDLEKIAESEQAANYKGTDHIGKTGLEHHYEFALHGETGYEQVEIDAGGRAIRSLSRTPPVQGNHLTLTLDVKLQEIAEKAFGDRRGALVAIEPSTGGILALVSSPTFDPNLFIDGIRTEDWDVLNKSRDRPMLNRALNGTYPPGSTYKPFMALAALETGRRTAGQTISDPGYFNFGGHHFRDDKVGGHGTVDMYKSIVQSCDTYYYQLATDMGIDAIAGFMGQLGIRPAHRRGHRRRIGRRVAVTGVEEAPLPAAGAAEMVCRRDRLDRHRPGLQFLHADSAGASDSDRRQQGRHVPSPSRQIHHRQPQRRKNDDRAGAAAPAAVEAEACRDHQERDDWRQHPGNRCPRLRRRRLHLGRQDRYGPGVQSER